MKHHPMTKEQREFLDRDLATITESLGNIGILLTACYGDKEPVRRAEEAGAAMQRLRWALERQGQPNGRERVVFGEAMVDDAEPTTAGGSFGRRSRVGAYQSSLTVKTF